jgi:hypothetical protein
VHELRQHPWQATVVVGLQSEFNDGRAKTVPEGVLVQFEEAGREHRPRQPVRGRGWQVHPPREVAGGQCQAFIREGGAGDDAVVGEAAQQPERPIDGPRTGRRFWHAHSQSWESLVILPIFPHADHHHHNCKVSHQLGFLLI